MGYINQNRYVFTEIKTGISDFKRFTNSYSFYLMRGTDGKLYVKRSDGTIDEEFVIKKDSASLNRYSVGKDFFLLDEYPDKVHVVVNGLDPYKFSSPVYDKTYYSYLESGVWKAINSISPLVGVSPSYAVLVRIDSGRMFLVFQEGNNVSVYELTTSSITKKSEIENFYLIDAQPSNEEILLFVSKIGINYPSEIVYEDFLSSSYEYFVNSPSVLVCQSSGAYATFSYLCTNRSVFPMLCKKGREENSFFINDGIVYAISLGFKASINEFIPVVALGKVNDSWRCPVSFCPFGDLLNVEKVYIAVDSEDTIYASCKKGEECYLVYYSRSENSWKEYDRTVNLSFDGARSSSSSSSCSSSSCSSSSCSSYSSASYEDGHMTYIDSDYQGDEYGDVWGDGTFIYAACYADGLRSYSVDGSGNLTSIDSDYQDGTYLGVWGDGTYVYVVCGYTGLYGIRSYSVDGLGNLTYIDQDNQASDYYGVWGDGNFVYAACGVTGLLSYGVDGGGNFTYIDSDVHGTGNYFGVWGDGTFVYVADSSVSGGLHSYSVDGSGNLTYIDSDYQGSGQYNAVWGDGTFIYVACSDGLRSYSVDGGGNLTYIDVDLKAGGPYVRVWGDGTFIYVTCYADGLRSYSVDGSGNLTYIDVDDQGSVYYGVWGDGTYVYAAADIIGLLSYRVKGSP